ncbi:MAG: HD domain-containing protein [Phycisphaerales bacterium]|jgi:HD-GYP domain-containing protein (c-di-GMP phosphodiesterase class II)|nr:HD domain-containing protein [Phycisphaerales bacterium]
MAEKPRLVIETIHGPEKPTLQLDGYEHLTIGRGEDNDLVLALGKTVSRKHAVLTKSVSQDGGFWKLSDSGSRHGTFLNGIKLNKGRGVRLRIGDLITIEPFTFQVVNLNDDKKYVSTFDDAQTISGTSILRVENTGGGVGLAQERLAALLECSRTIYSAENESAMAESVTKAASTGTSFNNIAIIHPAGGNKVEILAASGQIALDGSPNISRSLLDAAMEGEPVRFQIAEIVDKEAQSIMQYSIEEAICIPILLGSAVVGCIYADNRTGQVRDQSVEDDIEFCTGLAEIASLAISNLKRIDIERRYAEERSGFLVGTVSALVSAIDAKDTYTCGHSERVAWLSRELANAVQLDEMLIEQIHICGLVHDIGKIGIPEAILRKPGKLTDEEFDLIKSHPVIGENILKEVEQLKPVLPGVRSHHERWDGSGYPDGTKGEDTPLLGRILGIADAFDAMCSSRAYRKQLNREEVLDEITSCSGTQFDPELTKKFLTIDFIHYDVMIDFHISQASI